MWNDALEFIKAFKTLKQALCEAPILAHPRFNDPEAKWILDPDWSQENNACGVVISQLQDGVERPHTERDQCMGMPTD